MVVEVHDVQQAIVHDQRLLHLQHSGEQTTQRDVLVLIGRIDVVAALVLDRLSTVHVEIEAVLLEELQCLLLFHVVALALAEQVVVADPIVPNLVLQLTVLHFLAFGRLISLDELLGLHVLEQRQAHRKHGPLLDDFGQQSVPDLEVSLGGNWRNWIRISGTESFSLKLII